MEYDNDENIWRRRSSSLKMQRTTRCQRIPKRSTSVAVIVLGLAVLSCLFGYCVLSESLPYESKTLRLVIVFFRHGARLPIYLYKTDPYQKYQWPDGLGSLTKAGKLQMYELGKKFRSYYSSFIPEDYFEKDVYVRSSDSSRCLNSAYTFLAGLYPPSEDQQWHPELMWQPIPVHSLPTEMDNLVATTKACKVGDTMYQELLEEKSQKYNDVFEYLSKHINETVTNVLRVDFLYSTFMCEQDAGLKLPEWTRNVFPNKMQEPFMLSLALLTYNDTLIRYKVGPFLKQIKGYLEESVIHKDPERTLYLYSGHDVNIVGIWRALGYEELVEPGYGASLVLELHEEIEPSSSFFVKAFYRNNTKVEVPMELKLSFCDDPCPYEQFVRYIQKYIPDDWEAECQNHKTTGN